MVDERTQFEIYYPPFEGGVAAGLGSVMCSYNKICQNCDEGTWSALADGPTAIHATHANVTLFPSQSLAASFLLTCVATALQFADTRRCGDPGPGAIGNWSCGNHDTLTKDLKGHLGFEVCKDARVVVLKSNTHTRARAPIHPHTPRGVSTIYHGHTLHATRNSRPYYTMAVL